MNTTHRGISMMTTVPYDRTKLITDARDIAVAATTDNQASSAIRLDFAAELLRDAAQSCRGAMRTQLPDRDRIAAACDTAARLLELAGAEFIAGRCDGSPVSAAHRYTAEAVTTIDEAAALMPQSSRR